MTVRVRPVLRAVALGAVVTTCASACAALEVRDVSRPAIGSDTEPQPWLEAPGVRLTAYARHDRTAATFVGPALVVPLPVIPLPPGAPPPSQHFWIDLGVDPEGEDFTLDVRRVRLRLADGTSLAPSAFAGPVMYDLDGFRPTGLCHAWRAEERTPAVLPVTELACLSLRFDVAPPATDAKFSLSIDGLASGGRPLAAALIGFEHRRVHRLHFAP